MATNELAIAGAAGVVVYVGWLLFFWLRVDGAARRALERRYGVSIEHATGGHWVAHGKDVKWSTSLLVGLAQPALVVVGVLVPFAFCVGAPWLVMYMMR